MPDMKNRLEMDLTFSQRYGYEPLPQPMRLEQISADLRREIGNAFYHMLRKYSAEGVGSMYFRTQGAHMIERVLGKFFKQLEEKIALSYPGTFRIFREISLDWKFNKLIDLIQFIVNDEEGASLADHFQNLFEEHAAPYWLDTSRRPFRFFPRSSAEEGKAVQDALRTMHDAGMDGATTRLRQAAEHINARKYGPSVDDSVSAAEFVATKLDPKENKKLGEALDSLMQIGMLKDEHQTLKDAFKKLFGYASAIAEGRHGVSAENAPVAGLEEAMFIYGACASFSAYLVNKHHQQSTESESK
ncbi:MAG: hypothetical protein OD918_09780 [Gammaproteobacteria bacterium]